MKRSAALLTLGLLIGCNNTPDTNLLAPIKRAEIKIAPRYLAQADLGPREILVHVDHKYPWKDLQPYGRNCVPRKFDLMKHIDDLDGSYNRRFRNDIWVGIEGSLGAHVASETDKEGTWTDNGFELRHVKTSYNDNRRTPPGFSILAIGPQATPDTLRMSLCAFRDYVSRHPDLNVSATDVKAIEEALRKYITHP